MERFQAMLLDVWREACRHIEIHESTRNIAELLQRQMPLEQMVIERVDLEHRRLLVVAAAPATGVDWLPDGGRECTPAELKRLQRWADENSVVHRDDSKRLNGPLALLAPADLPDDLLAAPLPGTGGTILGAIVVRSKAGRSFESKHETMVAALREPFAVALENDQRLQEMAGLRQAAEADRQSLLNRLGRTTIVDTIVGEQSGLRQVIERVKLVAKSDVPVLILGETGTGKELIARAIHQRSERRAGPFIRVNCGAIPRELIDSQLFGHERGSFTGAAESRQGWFERANGGTLFLDEIGELPVDAQVRFLRVLQDGLVERVGGHESLPVDVRIVAATHRDLSAMVADHRFREDLWYRVAVFPILLPALRERHQDIAELAQHFAERAATRFGLAPVAPSEDDIQLLQGYAWPGNIRELGAVIDRAAILGEGTTLEIKAALGLSAPHAPRGEAPRTALSASAPHVDDRPRIGGIESLDDCMRQHIERALNATLGRIEGPKGAAALLKINPHTLRARMRKLGIPWKKFRE